MEQTNKTLKNIAIYHSQGIFYIAPKAQYHPAGLWAQILPVFEVKDNNIDDLAVKIEEAKQLSLNREECKDKSFEPWKENLFWREDTKYWALRWYQDGNAKIIPHIKDPKSKPRSYGWRGIPEKAKEFPAGNPMLSIAEELVKSVKE